MANPLQQVIQRSHMDKDKGESIFKETMRHLGLYAGLIAYTAVGAKVSYYNVTPKCELFYVVNFKGTRPNSRLHESLRLTSLELLGVQFFRGI